MKLYEFEGKAILRKFGIPVPEGVVAFTPEEARLAAASFGTKTVVKAQIFSGGRGKAGGIKIAEAPQEALCAAEALLGSTLKGEVVNQVLVEKCFPFVRELYLGFTVDPNSRGPVCILSTHGGVEVEAGMAESPGLFRKLPVDPYLGLHQFACLEAAMSLGLNAKESLRLAGIAFALYGAYHESDAVIAEINPLVMDSEGRFTALDAKFDLDDYAAFRHPEYAGADRIPGETAIEKRARELRLNYVELDGNIGIAGNGAGLMMTTVDVISRAGGRPGNFCDAGGANAKPGSGAGAVEWWSNVVQLVLSKPDIRVFLFNLHGGNHRGDEVAAGLVEGLARSGRNLPMVVRLSGTREDEGRAILAANSITSCDTMDEAVAKAVALANKE